MKSDIGFMLLGFACGIVFALGVQLFVSAWSREDTDDCPRRTADAIRKA